MALCCGVLWCALLLTSAFVLFLGFPLAKAEAYVKLRKPFCVNNLASERKLLDRCVRACVRLCLLLCACYVRRRRSLTPFPRPHSREFYRILTKHNVPVPRHVFLNRDDPTANQTVIETEDYLEIDGVRIDRPFVEKPVDAQNHNVYIYYPTRLGGGSKRLFRKVPPCVPSLCFVTRAPLDTLSLVVDAAGAQVGNQSSKFYPDVSAIRREGSFIYEEFVMTQVRGRVFRFRFRAVLLRCVNTVFASFLFLFSAACDGRVWLFIHDSPSCSRTHQGTDIKIYSVGSGYAHAEARKSPVLDGVVQRDDEGKEVRYPIMLNSREKRIAHKVM